MTIITDKMVFGGKSLGKIDGKNVFVPYTIPGEKIEIEIAEQNKKVASYFLREIPPNRRWYFCVLLHYQDRIHSQTTLKSSSFTYSKLFKQSVSIGMGPNNYFW